MHVGLAAKTGYGKSWGTQLYLEENLPEHDFAAVLDYKDEYRGLVEADLAEWFIAGPEEADYSPAQWAAVLEAGERVVIARYRIDGEEWREVVGNVAAACRIVGENHPSADILVGIDEAHIAAPQRGKFPEATKKIATTGRGEGLSSLWVSQRLSELAETIISQWDMTMLGGFTSDADLGKISVDYPSDVHDLRVDPGGCPPLPEALQVDGRSIPLRIWYDEDGEQVRGNEWIRASDRGTLERLDTRDVALQTNHYGGDTPQLRDPFNRE